MTGLEILGVWFAMGMTIFILSFLYEDNPFYKVAEHVFIGVTVGYSLVIIFCETLIPIWWEPMTEKGQYLLVVPGVLGLLVFSRFVPKLAWLSRPAFALLMGFGAGMAIPTAVDAFLLPQTSSTVRPIVPVADEGVAVGTGTGASEGTAVGEGEAAPGKYDLLGDVFSAVTDLLIVVITLCVLVYFFFSVENKGPARTVSRAGVLFLMVSFGIAYGNTVMGRMALLYDRIYDLNKYSSGDVWYATPILLVLTVGGLIWFTVKRPDRGAAGASGDDSGQGNPPSSGKTTE